MDSAVPTEKRCSKCGATKALADFYRHAQGKYGRFGWCKECQKADTAARRRADPAKHRARAKAEYQANREHVRALCRARYAADPARFKAANTKSKYGVTPELRAAMLLRQGGGCAVCGVREGSRDIRSGRVVRLHIDHDHRTGVVRWLLCHRCNSMIAMAQDDPARLARAAELLRAIAGHGREEATVADAEFMTRVHARAARDAQALGGRPHLLVPPGPPVPEAHAAEPSPPDPGPPVLAVPRLTQKQRTRLLHDDLAEVVNRHQASPETILMALELLRHQVLAPRLRQLELE